MSRMTCFLDDCDDVVHGLGMCKHHYQRHKRGSDITTPKNPIGKNHGLSYERDYGRWANMLDRCYNPNCASYSDYGERADAVKARKEAEVLYGYIS